MFDQLLPFLLIIIAAISYGIKDLLQAFVKKLSKKILKNEINVKEHPIFTKIPNYLENNKYQTFSTNAYKQAVIAYREKIFWNLVLENFIVLSNIDFENVTKQEFEIQLKKAFDNIDSYSYVMEKNGVSDKTILVMESAIIHLRLFINSLVNSIKNDSIYDTYNEKTWAIFTAYFEYLDFAHKSAIDLLVNANGNLKGEIFNSIINEGD